MAEYKKLPDGTIVKVAGQGGIADNLTTLSPVMSLSAKQGNALDTNKAERLDISSIITTGTKNTTGAQIASGTYFYLNGQLVKAKSNIAVNADYTLNTNYELATVGGVLTELNSKLGYKLLAANVPCGTETPFAISANKYIILAYYASTSIEFGYVPLMGNLNINNGFFVTSGSGDYARLKATSTGLNVDVYEHNGQPVTSSSTYTIYYR